MAGNFMRLLYLILICFAAPVAAFIASLRGLRDPERRERIADRFGRPKISPRAPVLWVHAASMGEVQAGAILVRRLLAAHPSREIVMTTMTATGAARVAALFPERVSHCYLPYDLPWAVRGFLDRVRPKTAVILETELWPTLLSECRSRSIPIVIASARISPRTADRYRRFAGLFRGALTDALIGAQSDDDVQRFKSIGATDVRVTGNIKFDIDVSASVRELGASLRARIGGRFVWVAGSTHQGEEEAALAAHRNLLEIQSDALLLLVPRHPQRFDEVRGLLGRSGLKFGARSDKSEFADRSVILVDTMGELLSCYAAADVAFVGGSLVDVGGHNLLEPAALGVATLCGPHMHSAQDVFDRMTEAHAVVTVATPQQLKTEVSRLAADSPARRALGDAAQSVVAANRGAIDSLMALINSRL